VGWAKPSQPSLVAGPSQWPAGQMTDARVKQFHACINSAKVIKLPSHCSNAYLNTEWNGNWAHLLLEMTKKAATLVAATLIRRLSSLHPLCPLSSLLLISQFLRWRSWEGNGYVCFLWIVLLIPGCSFFFAGTKIIAGTILLSVYATLFLSPSLRVCFFFSLCSAFFFLCSSSVFLGWFFGSVFFLFLIFHSFSVSSVLFFFLLCISALCFCSVFWVPFSPCARFSAPFYRDPQLAPNQSCLCKTVSSTNEIVGKGRGPRLDLLQIFSSPVESGWRRSHGSPTSNGDVSAKRHIFTFWPLNFGNSAIEPLSN